MFLKPCESNEYVEPMNNYLIKSLNSSTHFCIDKKITKISKKPKSSISHNICEVNFICTIILVQLENSHFIKEKSILNLRDN